MLSVENPPAPLCRCKVSALKSDERTPEILALPEADPAGLGEKQPPNFSIRDYVFTSRSKDIGKNWPFPQKYLQLCLKHGIGDLLPPFEPPNLVRAWCSGKSVISEQQVVLLEGEKTPAGVHTVEEKVVGSLDGESNAIDYELCLLSDQSVLGSSEQAEITLPGEDKLAADREGNFDDELTHGEAEIESTVTCHDQIEQVPSPFSTFPHIQETKIVSEASIEVVAAKIPVCLEKVESLRDPSQKKCRLIVKLGFVSEPSRAEDIASNSSMVSDSMASKVCPVCKTFSSTSNTTLNAHIDQCLSVESNAKRVVTKLSKHKVKPRKKKSMVDIYATAPHCTLEDLDRRNGSNWSVDLTLVASTNEVCTEIKRPRLSPVDPIDEGSEGEVYVDSNGTKLRILSKVSAAPPEAAGENFKARRLVKEIKEGTSFLFGTKKRFSPKYEKYMKVKLQGKKLSSVRSFKGEIQRASEGKFHQEKKECISQILNPPDQIKSGGSGTLSQWVCSKRSGLSKKFTNKVSYRSPRNLVAIIQNPLVESNQPDSGNSSAVGRHILKLSRPSDDFTSSQKTKSMDFLSNKVSATDYREKQSPVSPDIQHRILPENNFCRSMGNTASTANGLMLKLSRSSGNLVSSPRSKRVEIQEEATRKSNKFSHTTPKTSENCHPFSRKAKRKSNLRKSTSLEIPSCTMEVSKNVVEKRMISKWFRKRRYIKEACQPGGEFSSYVIEHLHDSTRDSDLGPASNNQLNRTCRSYFSDNIMRPEIEDVHDQVSPSQSNLRKFEKERESTSTLERDNYTALKQLQLGAECHGPELANGDMQVEASSNVDTVMISSVEKAVRVSATSETVTSEDHAAALNAKLHFHPSLEEQVKPTGGTEAWVEPSGPGLSNDPVMHCSNEVNNELICQNIPVAGQLESRAKGNAFSEFQYPECQNDTASIQGSSACLTSPGESGLEIPHENSSATSVRIVPTQVDNMEMERQSSESPVSVASNISHPSTKDFELKDLEPEPSMRPVAVQDKSSSDFCDSLALPSMSGLGGSEKTDIVKRNQEVNAISLVREPEKFGDAQPCCCSRREGPSRESPLLRQSFLSGTTLPAKGKQMASNLYTRLANSSFGTCPILRTGEMTNRILESPTDSLSTKASLDSAARIPTCGDFGSACPSPRTQPQSTPSPILRLMGKNLMVMSKDGDESVPLQKVAPCSSSTDPANTKYLPLLGFPSTGNVSNQDSFPYQRHRFLEGSVITGQCASNSHQMPLPLPAMQMGGLMGPSLKNGSKTKTDLQVQEELNWKTSSSFVCNGEKVALPHQRQKPSTAIRAPNPPREVIVIDDSPELETELKGSLLNQPSNMPATALGSNIRPARPFSYFPSQNPFSLMELPGEPRPGFPISCPRTVFNSTKRENSSEGPGTLRPSPFMVPSLSAGHLPPTLYYSPSLR